MTNICEYCSKQFTTKSNCTRHKLTCSIFLQQQQQEVEEKENQKLQQQRELENKLKEQEKNYEIQLRKKDKIIHDLEIKFTEKSTALSILQNNKPTIINHNNNISYNSNNQVNSNNNMFNILKPIDQVIEEGMALLNSDFVYNGVNGITTHIENETEILNNLFNSNKQRGTITYRKIDNPKLIKDERATDLANDIVKSIPLEKFDENRLGNLGIIHTDFMNLKSGNTDDVKKGISKFIVTKSKSEEALKNSIIDTSPIKEKISIGLSKFIFHHSYNPEHMIYFGIDSIIYFLLKNNYINCSNKIFNNLFFECMNQYKNIFKELYDSELKKMGHSHDYYDLTKESWHTIELFIDGSLNISKTINRLFNDFKQLVESDYD